MQFVVLGDIAEYSIVSFIVLQYSICIVKAVDLKSEKGFKAKVHTVQLYNCTVHGEGKLCTVRVCIED